MPRTMRKPSALNAARSAVDISDGIGFSGQPARCSPSSPDRACGSGRLSGSIIVIPFGSTTGHQQGSGAMMNLWRRGFMAGAGAALVAASGRRAAAAPEFKTVAPGVLTIANSNEMPMIAMEDGKLIGSDAEIIATIASKMGLGGKCAQMEWSATVQSVKSGRADVMLGNMGWTPARAQALLITDAIYYAGTFVCMKKDKPFNSSFTVNDVKGR